MTQVIQSSECVSGLSTILGVDLKPAERTDHRVAHFRDAKRDPCKISCDVVIVLGNGLNYDTGTAHLSNLSPTGALLTELRLQRGSLPLAPFNLTLRLHGKHYDGVRIEATPVRLPAGGFSLGVQFDGIAAELY